MIFKNMTANHSTATKIVIIIIIINIIMFYFLLFLPRLYIFLIILSRFLWIVSRPPTMSGIIVYVLLHKLF